MCNGSDKEIEKYFRKVWYVKFTRSPILAMLYLPVLINRIREIVINEKYDIVHVHTPIASFITRISMALIEEQKRPTVIYTAHGFHFHPLGNRVSNFLFERIEKLAAKYTDYLITINEWDYSMALKSKLLPENRIFYIKGIGVDSSFYDPENFDDRDVKSLKEHLCSDCSSLFCVIGEFTTSKRHIDIFKALKNLEGVSIKVALVGDGRLKRKMVRKAKKLEIMDKVVFLGYRNDIPLVLKASDAMLLPSIREGMPRVVMEAMAMRTPVIATEIRGVKELLSGGYGILVEPRNIQDISKAMIWLIQNEKDAKEMAKEAREKIIREHDIKVVLPQHLEVYHRALLRRLKISK